MHDTVAIDFGTMRTKLAYNDPQRGSVELMRLGQDERPFQPSIFFLGEDGRRLFGDDAAEYLDSDPLAFLSKPLKRELREQWVRAGNRVKATPTELLTLLFSGLRERTKELPPFREALPVALRLTIPAQYGPPDREILATAAHNAGFAEDRINFVDEPIAAAQAWLTELGGKEEYVIVLDCGGGTLDWACLHRGDASTFTIVPELPPSGDNRVGGFDIDEALFAHVDDTIADAATRTVLEKNRCLVRDQLRTIKEKYSRTGLGGRIRVDSMQIEIPPDLLAETVQVRFISQACQNLDSYLEKVRAQFNLENPTVLLVGGSARLRGFQQAIVNQCKCNAVWWERSEYATVLGALSSAKKPKRNARTAPVQTPSTETPVPTTLPAVVETRVAVITDEKTFIATGATKYTEYFDTAVALDDQASIQAAIAQLNPKVRKGAQSFSETLLKRPELTQAEGRFKAAWLRQCYRTAREYGCASDEDIDAFMKQYSSAIMSIGTSIMVYASKQQNKWKWLGRGALAVIAFVLGLFFS